MRSSFTKTKKALFKSNASQSVDATRDNGLEEDKEQKNSKKSKKTEGKNSFRQISNLFRIKKHRGKSSSNLPDDILKEGNDFSRNRSQLLSLNEANESKFDRSFSYSDIKMKPPEGTCFIDSEKYLIVDERRQPVDGDYHKKSSNNNSFIRHRKAQMSMRKAFGIYDEITSPDLICDLETTLTHSSSTITTSNHSLEQPPSPHLPHKKRPHSSKCATISHNEVPNYKVGCANGFDVFKEISDDEQPRLHRHHNEHHEANNRNSLNHYGSNGYKKSEVQALRYNDLNSKSMLANNNSFVNNNNNSSVNNKTNTTSAFDSSLLTYENSYASYKSRNSLPHSLYYTSYSLHNYNLNHTAPLNNPLDQSTFLNHPLNHTLGTLNENLDSNSSLLRRDSGVSSETGDKRGDVGSKEPYKVDDYPTLKADTYAEQLRKRLSFSHNSSAYYAKNKTRMSVDSYAYNPQNIHEQPHPNNASDTYGGMTQRFFANPLTHNNTKAQETHFEVNESLGNKQFQERNNHQPYNNTSHQHYNDKQNNTPKPDYRRSLSVVENSTKNSQHHGMYMYPNYKNTITPFKPLYHEQRKQQQPLQQQLPPQQPLQQPQQQQLPLYQQPSSYQTQQTEPQPKQRRNKEENKHNTSKFDNLPDLTTSNTSHPQASHHTTHPQPIYHNNTTHSPLIQHNNHLTHYKVYKTTNHSTYDDNNSNTESSVVPNNTNTSHTKPTQTHNVLNSVGDKENLYTAISIATEHTADNNIITISTTPFNIPNTPYSNTNVPYPNTTATYSNTTTTPSGTPTEPSRSNPITYRASIFEKKYKPINFTASLASHNNNADTTNDKTADGVVSTTYEEYNETSNNHTTTQNAFIEDHKGATTNTKDVTLTQTTITTQSNDVEAATQPENDSDKKKEIEGDKNGMQVSKSSDEHQDKDEGGVDEVCVKEVSSSGKMYGEGGSDDVANIQSCIVQAEQQLNAKVIDNTTKELTDESTRELNEDIKSGYNFKALHHVEVADKTQPSESVDHAINSTQTTVVLKSPQNPIESWYVGRELSIEEKECDRLMMKMSLKLQHNNEYLSKIFRMHLNLPSLFIDSQHLVDSQSPSLNDKEKNEENEEEDGNDDIEKDKMRLEEMLVMKMEMLHREEGSMEEEIKENLVLHRDILKEIEDDVGERMAGKFASWWMKMDNMVKLMMKLKMMLMRNINALHTLPSNSPDADKELLLKKSCDLKEKIREANVIRLDLQQEYHTWVQALQQNTEQDVVRKAEQCVSNKCRHSVQLDDLQSRLHTTQSQLQSLRNTMHNNSVGSLC